MKKALLLLVFFVYIFVQVVRSQIPDVSWGRGAGGNLYDYGFSVATDGIGNTYVTGNYKSNSISFGSYTFLNPDSSAEVYLVKYNPNGNVLWAVNGSGNNENWGNCMATDADGNVFLTGFFTGSMDLAGTLLTSNDTLNSTLMFIAKFDAGGNKQWINAAGGSYLGSACGNGCATDASGAVCVCGSFSGKIGFDSDTLKSLTGNQAFIVKYDADGNEIWAEQSDSLGHAEAQSIAVTPGGSIFITGNIRDTTVSFGGNSLEPEQASMDIFIANYSSSGSCNWAEQAYGPLSDQGINVTTDPGGNAYITGQFCSKTINFGGITLNNADQTVLSVPDAFIV